MPRVGAYCARATQQRRSSSRPGTPYRSPSTGSPGSSSSAKKKAHTPPPASASARARLCSCSVCRARVPCAVYVALIHVCASACAGARCSLFAALAEETASVRGRYFENCTERVRAVTPSSHRRAPRPSLTVCNTLHWLQPPNPVSHNRGLMTQLWEHSEAWTGLAE